MKIGDPSYQEVPTVKRWIKSPFQSKAYEKHFHENDSLVKIAGSYFAHADSKQALLVLQDGKCIDPRILIKDVPELSIVTVRACPLLGGVKNADVRKMLQDQFSARGVSESCNVQNSTRQVEDACGRNSPEAVELHQASGK